MPPDKETTKQLLRGKTCEQCYWRTSYTDKTKGFYCIKSVRNELPKERCCPAFNKIPRPRHENPNWSIS